MSFNIQIFTGQVEQPTFLTEVENFFSRLTYSPIEFYNEADKMNFRRAKKLLYDLDKMEIIVSEAAAGKYDLGTGESQIKTDPQSYRNKIASGIPQLEKIASGKIYNISRYLDTVILSGNMDQQFNLWLRWLTSMKNGYVEDRNRMKKNGKFVPNRLLDRDPKKWFDERIAAAEKNARIIRESQRDPEILSQFPYVFEGHLNDGIIILVREDGKFKLRFYYDTEIQKTDQFMSSMQSGYAKMKAKRKTFEKTAEDFKLDVEHKKEDNLIEEATMHGLSEIATEILKKKGMHAITSPLVCFSDLTLKPYVPINMGTLLDLAKKYDVDFDDSREHRSNWYDAEHELYKEFDATEKLSPEEAAPVNQTIQ